MKKIAEGMLLDKLGATSFPIWQRLMLLGKTSLQEYAYTKDFLDYIKRINNIEFLSNALSLATELGENYKQQYPAFAEKVDQAFLIQTLFLRIRIIHIAWRKFFILILASITCKISSNGFSKKFRGSFKLLKTVCKHNQLPLVNA